MNYHEVYNRNGSIGPVVDVAIANGATALFLPNLKTRKAETGRVVKVANVTSSVMQVHAADGDTIGRAQTRLPLYPGQMRTFFAWRSRWIVDGPPPDGLWDDFQLGVVGINPPGSEVDYDIDPETGMALFDDSRAEVMATQIQMPHRWVARTDIRPHIHVSAREGGEPGDGEMAAVWRLELRWYNNGEEIPVSWESEDITVVYDEPGDNDNPILQAESFPVIPGAGKNESSFLQMKISRRGSNNDESDTYNDDSELHAFDIHMRVRDTGSWEEFGDTGLRRA